MQNQTDSTGFMGALWAKIQSLCQKPGDTIPAQSLQHNHNTKEVVLCLLLVIMFSKVDQARQYIQAFAGFLYSDINNNGFTIFEFAGFVLGHAMMIFWLAFVFWQMPLKLAKPDPKNRVCVTDFSNDKEYYGRFSNIWKTSMIAALPFVIFYNSVAIALLKEEATANDNPLLWDNIFSKSERSSNTFLLANLISIGAYFGIGYLCKSNLFRSALGKIKRPVHALMLMGIIAVLAIFMGYHYFLDIRPNLVLKHLVLGFYIIAPALATALFFYRLAWRLVSTDTRQVEYQNRIRKIVEVMKWISLVLIVVFFVMLNTSAVTQHEGFSRWFFPTSVIIFAFVCYYSLLDLLSFNIQQRFLRPALFCLLLIVFFFGMDRHYYVKFNAEETMGRTHRVSLEKYFLTWAKQQLDDRRGPEVYLVAAEGGGSRSGAWTTTILTSLDSASNGEFRHHCFAFSGVSGGSLGLAATISIWDNANQKGWQSINYDSLKIKNYVRTLFGRNYVTSALAGIFFYDFIQQIPLLNFPYSRHLSRTDRLNNEECDAVQRGLGHFFNPTTLPADYFKRTNFLSLYYGGQPEQPTLKTRLPLFFPNTARVQDGKRGILSAVKKDDLVSSPFNPSALDIIGMCKGADTQNSKSCNMSLGGATALSELFPFVNSTVTIGDSIGTFMDGGIYENFGITTLHEVMTEIRRVCDEPDQKILSEWYSGKDSLQRKTLEIFLREMAENITVILIHASAVKASDNKLEDEVEPPAQFLSPLTTLLKTPFAGHSDYAYHHLLRHLNGKAQLFEFILNPRVEKGKPIKDVTMSRWLSPYELKEVSTRAQVEIQKNRLLLDTMGKRPR